MINSFANFVRNIFDAKKCENKNIIFYICMLLIISRLLLYLTYIVIAVYTSKNTSFVSFIDALNSSPTDHGWYNHIINSGYVIAAENGQAVWAFFPLMPLIIKAIHFVVPISTHILGFFFNSFLLVATCFTSHKYIICTRSSAFAHKISLLVIFLLMFGPFSYYSSSLLTESLFMFLLILCLYFTHKEKYILVGVFGALLSATRNTGIFFIFVPVVHEIYKYIESNKKNGSFKQCILKLFSNSKMILGCTLIPIGFFSFVLFLHFKLGDGFAFIHVQRAWGREFRGFFHVFFDFNHNFSREGILCFSAVVVSIFMLIYTCFAKRPYEIILPGLTIIAGGISTFMSMQRYMYSALVPLFAFCEILIIATERMPNIWKRGTRISVCSLLFGFEVALSVFYMMGVLVEDGYVLWQLNATL